MKYRTTDGELTSEVLYDLGRSNQIEQRHLVDSRYTEQLKCVYLSPRYEANASMEGLQNIYRNKDEAFLSEALKVLEPAAQIPFASSSMQRIRSSVRHTA